MKRVKILVLLIGMVLAISLLVSCSANSGQKVADYNFKQGMAGLNLKLLENAPPDQLYPRASFKVIVEADNQAAYDIHDGVITLVGLDEKYFKILPREQSFEVLSGRSLTTPAGEKVFLEFDGTSGDLFQNAEQYSNTYFIKAKFNSRFEFVDTICLNPSLYEIYDAGCKVKNQKKYQGQGAPVAVVEMQEIMYPGTSPGVEFRLRLQNRGGAQSKVRFVNVEQASLGGVPVRCVFQGAGSNPLSIHLEEKQQEAILVCSTALRDQSSYETTLALEFSYDYEMSVEKRLRLVNPLKLSKSLR